MPSFIPIYRNIDPHLPVIFSASLKVTSSSTMPTLRPLELTANTAMRNVTSGSRLARKKVGWSRLVRLYRGTPESAEYSSNRKYCGNPPSKPGWQLTSTELLVWLESVQLRTGNGFPAKQATLWWSGCKCLSLADRRKLIYFYGTTKGKQYRINKRNSQVWPSALFMTNK